MKRRAYPKPVLDSREEALTAALQKEFEDFTKPGVVGRGLKNLGNAVDRVVPKPLKKAISDVKSVMDDWDLIHNTLETAERGFQLLTQQASRMTVSKQGVIRTLSARGRVISTFEEVCLQRSYLIEAVIEDKTHHDLLLAAMQGAATGMFGFAGLPFNMTLSFFLYFRAAQNVALHYGYDVKSDPRELQFAAEVTMQSLEPNFSGEGLGGLIGKMMSSAHLPGLKQSLAKLGYVAAGRGSSELLYVQARALASKAAEQALAKAGREGIEAGVFKSLVEQLARRMPGESGRRAVPLFGALLGGMSDAYLMGRILRGAKLIYHKRYLFEKEHRISLLKKTRAPRKRPRKTAGTGGEPGLAKPARAKDEG